MAPDDEIRGDMMLMRARARDLVRNDALVKQFLNLLTANVTGPRGPRMQARVRDAKGELLRDVNAAIEEAWLRWSENAVTVDRRLTLTEFAHLQLCTTTTDGEALSHLRPGPERPHGLAL